MSVTVHLDTFRKGPGRWVVYDYKLHAAGGSGFVPPKWRKGSITANDDLWTPDTPENGMILPLLFYFAEPVDMSGCLVTANIETKGPIAEQDIGFWILSRDNTTRWHCLTRRPVSEFTRWDLRQMKWVRGWARKAEAPPRAALSQVWSCGFSFLEDMGGSVTLKQFQVARQT